MDIYSALKHDHDEVKELLEKLADSTERAQKTRESGFEKLRQELTAHSRAEEAVFYSRLEDDKELREQVLEGREEHHLVDQLLEEMAAMDVTDEQWTAKLAVLKEQIEHHVEEEEDELFHDARRVLDDGEANQLAERFQDEKQQYLNQ